MIKATFSEEEIKYLCKVILEHSHHFVRARALALLLKALGVSTKKTSKSMGICENTVCNHLKIFMKEGMSSVVTVKFHRPKSRLEVFKPIIQKYLDEKKPETVKQACIEIEELTKVNLKETQLRKFLKSIGGIQHSISQKKENIPRKKEKAF